MAGFRKKIVVNQETLDLEFTEIYNPSGLKYFVTVHNGRKPVSSFEMRKALRGWNIIPPAPSWINELQDSLGQMLNEELNNG